MLADSMSKVESIASNGIHQITTAMHQLNQVTEQNSTKSQIAAKAAPQVASQADILREVVSSLTFTVHGTRKAS
jgi:methyl-accepting chemotaxis protein